MLAELVTFIVFPRGGVADEKDAFRMLPVDASFDASSTEVRRRVGKGEPIDDLVVPEVETVIRERGLYREPS